MGSGPSPERFGIPGTALGEKELSGWGNHPGISPGTVRVPRSPPAPRIPNKQGKLEPDAFAPTELISGTARVYSPSLLGSERCFSPFPLHSQQLNFPQPSQIITSPLLFFPPFPPLSSHFPDKTQTLPRVIPWKPGIMGPRARGSAQPCTNDGNKLIYSLSGNKFLPTPREFIPPSQAVVHPMGSINPRNTQITQIYTHFSSCHINPGAGSCSWFCRS